MADLFNQFRQRILERERVTRRFVEQLLGRRLPAITQADDEVREWCKQWTARNHGKSWGEQSAAALHFDYDRKKIRRILLEKKSTKKLGH